MSIIKINMTGGGISSSTPPEKPKLRIIELCAGIGAQYRGLCNTGLFDVEVAATSEIDVNAIIAYAAIHHDMTAEMVANYKYPPLDEMRQYLTELNIGYDPVKDKKYDWFKNGKKFEEQIKKTYLACILNKNLGDMSKIGRLPKADVWFTSTPCTDLSVAGKLKGMNPDDKTRSSLIWQNIRLLREAQVTDTLPKYIFLENVKNLVGKKFIHDFETFNELVESFGYYVYWKVINAKDCGVPQNRERVFAIYIRTDIDTGKLTWPIPFDNGLRLKDVLEEEVDESYYINTQKAQDLIQRLLDEGVIGNDNPESRAEQMTVYANYNKIERVDVDVARAVLSRDYKGFGGSDETSNGVVEVRK